MAKAELPLLLTAFGELELINALHLRAFRRELRPNHVKTAQATLRKDMAAGLYFLKPLPAAVFERALRISRQRTPHLGTRTLDLLHVASALDLKADVFYTFDRHQHALAQDEGLKILPAVLRACP